MSTKIGSKNYFTKYLMQTYNIFILFTFLILPILTTQQLKLKSIKIMNNINYNFRLINKIKQNVELNKMKFRKKIDNIKKNRTK